MGNQDGNTAGQFCPLIDCLPADFSVEDSGSGDGRMIVTPIAVSHDGQRTVSVLVELDPTEYDGTAIYEFSFAILITYEDGQPPLKTQDRNVARPYLEGDLPSLTLSIVCECVDRLIEELSPVRVYRVTKERNPPACAMHKHNMITDRLRDCGYEISQTGTDPLNRTFWLMERLP